jgi:hypothetical protein
VTTICHRNRNFHEEVLVVGHQHEGVLPPTVGFDGPAEPIDAALAVGVVANNGLSLIAPRHDVMQCPWKIDPKWPSHAGKCSVYSQLPQALLTK